MRAVSPELMLRPSLSGLRLGARGGDAHERVAGAYAPAFVERARRRPCLTHDGPGVAGAYAPAFVERSGVLTIATMPLRRVAGAYAPAFVERTRVSKLCCRSTNVSPELMLRPSLSGP